MSDFDEIHNRVSDVFNRRIVFVAGATRWGTAWVQQCLGAHADIAAEGEGHFTDILFPRMAELVEDYNAQCEKVGNRMKLAGFSENAAGFTHEETDHLLRTAIGLIFARWQAAGEARVIVEKTPEHVVALDILSRIVPEALFIHVFRDGRDEALAAWEFNMGLSRGEFPRTYPTFADFAEVFAGNWNRSIDAARRFGRVHRERYLDMRAEDFMLDPLHAAERLFTFVGADVDRDMVRAASDAAWDLAPLDLEEGAWQTSFDDHARSAFTRQAGELLKLLGYEV